MNEKRHENKGQNRFFALATLFLILAGLSILWMASLRIPALEDISERKVSASTKIYDRTGQVLLYDMAKDVKREQVAYDQISPFVRDAAVAIEDKDFYKHNGFKFTSFMRAVITNLTTLSFSQGGSTITQQVVKNSILTKDKTPTRKIKELILALKLEKVLTKEQILTLYLNEIPYGGTIYGIEEASEQFFGTSASDLTLAQAAYLAAIPKAPTFYSPYGPNLERLSERKALVLSEMLNQGYITQEQYDGAINEKVTFKPRGDSTNIKAPHFVFFVIDYLTEKYGENALQNGGFKVVTTLDYSIQSKAEEVAKKYGPINEENFGGKNNSIVAIDPKTGEILAMVGSRDYFDKSIDGNFNVATSHRQPGSTFKPFVYSTLFNKGFTDSTVLMDVPIQFNPNCAWNDFVTHDQCYAPVNYDDKFRGPMTIRDALAQSINLPAVQAIYLAGVKDSIKTAQAMGIEGLEDTNRFGLSLVLGGGDVSLLDMTSAYSVFANDGVRNAYNPILWVEDENGSIIDKPTPFPHRVLPEQSSRMITSILSDNVARTPGYGPNSPLHFADREVAVKTGTSNDYRDTWIIGYTPNLTVGAWVGNNDNSAMEKKVAGMIVAPLWRELMDKVLPEFPVEYFTPMEPIDPNGLKPVLKGDWASGGVHSILYWVDKANPRGSIPSNPGSDPQFDHWERSVMSWFGGRNSFPPGNLSIPTSTPTPAAATELIFDPNTGLYYSR